MQSEGRATRSGVELLQSEKKLTIKWENNLGLSLCVLYLNLLLHVWLRISGGRNCCQECRRGVVYRLIGVEIDIKDVNDFNLLHVLSSLLSIYHSSPELLATIQSF